MRSLTRIAVAMVAIGTALVPSSALAQSRRAVDQPSAPKPFFDARDAQRRAVERSGAVSLRPPDARTRGARARLRAAGAGVDIDVLTGTPRTVVGRTAPLSGPASGDRRDVAERYLHAHLPALGLAAADLGSLRLEERRAIPGGAQLLAWGQYADGIPSFDGALRVALDSAGRVISVTGAVQPGLALNTTAPALTAQQAMQALSDNVGVSPAPRVVGRAGGVRRTTEFAGGETAALVAFAEGTSARLGWQLDLRAGPAAHYAAVVDAVTGRVLYRANRVKSAANDALVWEQYPGAANGGTAQTRDLTPYLNPGATDLSGPYAHAWSDLNDNDSTHLSGGHIVPLDQPDAGEAVNRGPSGNFSFPFDEFTPAENSGGACDSAHKCSWNFVVLNSYQVNQKQNAVQAFYYVNRYRDHLTSAPISFTSADGNFDNGDRVLVNADDGATTGTGGARPDANHRDNAYMDTPPDGTSPTMAMFLFFKNGLSSPFRDVNGGDDAAIVYHEYTHGLSSRLITSSPGGEQALNGPQSGGMGEGWSDFYAKDFLVDQFPADDTATPGEVDMGKYVDSPPHSIRSQGLDCPVSATAPQCPGGLGATDSGGYTYGDFNKLDIDTNTGQREVHEVGEIWAETLWDLRAALGSNLTEALVTQGMRLSPAEPTFLDERDAILAADRQLFPEADHSGAIWSVFATRGMGPDAQSVGQDAVVESFKRPPTAALSVSPSSATAGSPVTFDASGSTDPDGSITSFDFDFDGDGIQDVAGTTNPRQSFAYNRAGTFHPVVTVHDNDGQTDTAEKRVDVSGAVVVPPPPVTPRTTSSTSHRPVITLARKGTKGRLRFKVKCDSVCAGSAKLTVSRKLAKKLHLTRRTVGTKRFTLAKAGTKRFTVKLNKRTLRAMRKAGVKRVALKLSAKAKDNEGQRASKRRSASIRR